MPLTTSVVLCTWNGTRFLPAQWASVLAQSRLPDEILVRDDASTDTTVELLASLAAKADARGVAVRSIRGERNLGYVANFETALQAASGEVLFLCDQDDVWHPDKLATQLGWFEARSELLLLCGDARRIDADGALVRRSLFEVLRVSRGELRRIHAGDGFDVLLRRSLATGATIALRREFWLMRCRFPMAGCMMNGSRSSRRRWMASIASRRRWSTIGSIKDINLGCQIVELWRNGAACGIHPQICAMHPSGAGNNSRSGCGSLRARRRRPASAAWRKALRTCARGYRRFGSGWRSVLRDLARRR